MELSSLPTFHTDLFVPRFSAARSGAWEVRVCARNFVPGYWSGTVLVEGMAALLRNGVVWMSMTPYEIESQEIGVRLSKGHVLICGLGMGWSAAVCALRDEVSAVTVVENDAEVIALHRELKVFSQLPPPVQTKLNFVHADAYAYVPDRDVDCLMPDVWQPLVSDGRVEEVGRMQANIRARHIYFWGQEMEIARRARAEGRILDAEGIAMTIRECNLPLVGLEYPGYADIVRTVSDRWMKGRWLDGGPLGGAETVLGPDGRADGAGPAKPQCQFSG